MPTLCVFMCVEATEEAGVGDDSPYSGGGRTAPLHSRHRQHRVQTAASRQRGERACLSAHHYRNPQTVQTASLTRGDVRFLPTLQTLHVISAPQWNLHLLCFHMKAF